MFCVREAKCSVGEHRGSQGNRLLESRPLDSFSPPTLNRVKEQGKQSQYDRNNSAHVRRKKGLSNPEPQCLWSAAVLQAGAQRSMGACFLQWLVVHTMLLRFLEKQEIVK